MTDSTSNDVPAGHSAYEVSQGGHSGVMDSSSLLPAADPMGHENGFVSAQGMEGGRMDTQSANAVPVGHSAPEVSQVPTTSSTASLLLASFVKFFNASLHLPHVSYQPRSSQDVRYSYRVGTTTYLFGSDTPTFLLCPTQTVHHEIRPSKYANGMWRNCERKYFYHSDGKSEYTFDAHAEDKLYVTGGSNSASYGRHRKQEFVMNDGTKKMYAIREHPGRTKKLLSETPKTEDGLNALLRTHGYSMVWLDTSLPKTNEFVTLASLEFRRCCVWQDSTVQGRSTYMLFVKIVKLKNGQQQGVSYYPLHVSLTDFSTKGAVPPLFESEIAEMVREQRGNLKREIAEAVFRPMRVFKMMETYGDDWDEKV